MNLYMSSGVTGGGNRFCKGLVPSSNIPESRMAKSFKYGGIKYN